MSERPESKRTQAESDIWTLDETAAHFKCSAPTVKKMTREKSLPYFMMGRLWRFRRVEVLAWEQTQMQNRQVA